jgi:hypothetical protein
MKMNLAEKCQARIDDLYKFYSTHNPDHRPNKNRFINAVYNHRFLGYSIALNWIWQPAYYGSAVVSLFDQGQYNPIKLTAMAATSPALLTATVLYGAFWAKLGTAELLKDAWEKDRLKTASNIALYSFLGNFYQIYYKLYLLSEATEKVTTKTLDQLCKLPEPAGSCCIRTIEFLNRLGARYFS